jgi:hypothetical protein
MAMGTLAVENATVLKQPPINYLSAMERNYVTDANPGQVSSIINYKLQLDLFGSQITILHQCSILTVGMYFSTNV